MLTMLIYALAAIGVLALLSRTIQAYTQSRHRRNRSEFDRQCRTSVQAAYESGEAGLGWTVGEDAGAIKQDEWVRIAYQEYRKWFIELSTPGEPPGHRPLDFEAWIVQTLQRQEHEAWRAYFARMEREWGQSLAQRSIAQWPGRFAEEAIAWEDRTAERPSFARSYRDLNIEKLSWETWRHTHSPIYYILHPELPRPAGWDGKQTPVNVTLERGPRQRTV